MESIQPDPNLPIQTPQQQKTELPTGVIVGFILLILIASLIACYFAFRPQIDNLILKPAITKIGQRLTPVPTTDPTLSWKTFTEKAGRFNFKYPTDFTLKEEVGGNNDVYYVTLKSAKEEFKFSSGPKIKSKIYAQFATTDTENINGTPWNVVMSSQYCDPLNCEATAPGYYVIHNDFYVGVNQNDKINDRSSLKPILNTLKFTDSNAIPTSTCMPRPACLDAKPRCMIVEPANGWCK